MAMPRMLREVKTKMLIDQNWYVTRINLLKQKEEFLEQQKQVFQENGFEKFANEITKEIKYIQADLEDLSYEMTIKIIDKPIGVK